MTSSVSPFELPVPAGPNDVITSLRRGLTILELLANEPEGLLAKTVSFRTGLNLSTCYHLLNTLMAAGYVAKQPRTQRFALTGKISFPTLTSIEQAHLLPQLQPHLHTLRDLTSETAYLSLRHHNEIVVSAIVDSPQALKVSLLHVGYNGAAHAMALGKAILAYLDEHDVSAYLFHCGMPALTHKTISEEAAFKFDLANVRLRGRNVPKAIGDDEEFKFDLANVRLRGYSLDLEEFVAGVCCIGAPIFGVAGRVVASLAISLPASRYYAGSDALVRHVCDAAAAATRTLTLLRYAQPSSYAAVP